MSENTPGPEPAALVALPDGWAPGAGRPQASQAVVGLWRPALLAYRDMLRGIWRGDTISALALASTPRTWIVPVAVNSLLLALLVESWLIHAVSSAAHAAGWLADQFTDGLAGSSVEDHVTVPFGVVVAVFLGVVVGSAAVHLLRWLIVRWTFSVRHAQVGGAPAGAIVTAGSAVLAVPLLLMLVATIPGLAVATVLSPLLAAVVLMATIVAEGIVYIGLNRTVRFEKSALVPHAVLTAVWFAGATLVGGIVMLSVASSMRQ